MFIVCLPRDPRSKRPWISSTMDQLDHESARP
jgi:hypothetical protein